MSTEPTYVIMPILAAPGLTETAIADVLAQSVPIRLLLINQGVDDAFRDHLERIAEQESERVLLWSHQPPLPSLSASWNRALDFVWEAVGEVGEQQNALVVNNDVRLHRRTVEVLRLYLHDEDALFVSAVGVTADQFDPEEPSGIPSLPDGGRLTAKGGPDFSCFLISRDCHERFRFDEGFIPAHTEDLDLHRRIMLAGDGQRIFSVNLPYLHYAAQTIKQSDPATRARIERETAAIARVHYRKKWGGDCNQERFYYPFDRPTTEYKLSNEALAIDPPTTSALFDFERTQWAKHLTS